jgi:hypothetical protein
LPPAFYDVLVAAAKVPRIAALLDADNIDAHHLSTLRGWFERRGELLVFRAYGNRNTFAGPLWNDALEAGLDPIVCDVRPQAADMTLAVDLGILAMTREHHELFVISGDRALSIAAEHVAARFGERQRVYCGQPQAVLRHTEQCRLGIKHARIEEIVGLLQLLIHERRRVRSDDLHRELLDMVPWFHPRIYQRGAGFTDFVAEHFAVERASDGYWVSLPEEGSSPGLKQANDLSRRRGKRGGRRRHRDDHRDTP